MPRNYNGAAAGLAAPALAHTLTESAEDARRAVRAHAIKKKTDALVTNIEDHRPKPAPEWPIPANAARLAAMATELDYEVRIVHGYATQNAGQVNESQDPAVQVAGKSTRAKVGFRAVWVRKGNGWRAWRAQLYEPGDPPTGKAVTVTAVIERVGR